MKDTIIQKLKKLCEQKNISYYQLAKMANISNSTIYNIMNGNTQPRFDTLQDLCKALDVELEDFLMKGSGIHGIHSDISEEDLELIHMILSLSPEKKQMIKLYVKMVYQYHLES